jgi:hypothetical protein
MGVTLLDISHSMSWFTKAGARKFLFFI